MVHYMTVCQCGYHQEAMTARDAEIQGVYHEETRWPAYQHETRTVKVK